MSDTFMTDKPDFDPETTGKVEWDFNYRAMGDNDTESPDQAGTQEEVIEVTFDRTEAIISPDEQDVHNINRRLEILAQRIALLESREPIASIVLGILIVIALLILAVILIIYGHPWGAFFFVLLASLQDHVRAK